MSNKFPVYLTNIEISSEGEKKFIKSSKPYRQMIWGTLFDKYFFNFRKAYFKKPNCSFECPPGKEFHCCETFGCQEHCGFFEWEEISFFSEEEKEKILSSWDNETGFLGEGGCVLPRELRSFVCLSHSCRYSKNKKQEEK
jgi:hypothetical protein